MQGGPLIGPPFFVPTMGGFTGLGVPTETWQHPQGSYTVGYAMKAATAVPQ